MKKLAVVLILVSFSCILDARIVHTIFGDIDEKNPAILSILDSDAMERLKHIDQSGPDAYFTHNFPTFSRYDHSLGVYALLKKFNVSEQEQLAGLLHDASHTVFSHVGDLVFQDGDDRQDSYQDSIHNWYLEKSGVDKILNKYGISVADVSPKNAEFTALEQPFPDMNADRIEYNLHTGIVFKDITENDAEEILTSLKYDDGNWYFTDIVNAKRLAKLSTYYTKTFWGSPRNIALYTVTAAVIKRAIEQGVLDKQEFIFGIDEEVITKLSHSEDKKIKQLFNIMEDIDNHFVKADESNFDVFQPIKMRGINPLVLHENDLVRLSDISLDYKNDLDATEEYSKRGVYIKFVNVKDKNLLKILKNANT